MWYCVINKPETLALSLPQIHTTVYVQQSLVTNLRLKRSRNSFQGSSEVPERIFKMAKIKLQSLKQRYSSMRSLCFAIYRFSHWSFQFDLPIGRPWSNSKRGSCSVIGRMILSGCVVKEWINESTRNKK